MSAARRVVSDCSWAISLGPCQEKSCQNTSAGLEACAAQLSSSVTIDGHVRKGYGFVKFTNKDGYSSAVAQDHHVLENSKLTLGASYSNTHPPTPSTLKSLPRILVSDKLNHNSAGSFLVLLCISTMARYNGNCVLIPFPWPWVGGATELEDS